MVSAKGVFVAALLFVPLFVSIFIYFSFYVGLSQFILLLATFQYAFSLFIIDGNLLDQKSQSSSRANGA